jgi:predicted nucleic acid-binding Zn ribbon protein
MGYDAAMAQGRRRRGFEQVGCLPASQLGLPSRLAKELLLAAAWRHVAGETIARRAVVRVNRGVLEIRVPDGHWATTMAELIPRIAGRMAAAYPQLGVRKFRMQREGQSRPARATTIEEVGC